MSFPQNPPDSDGVDDFEIAGCFDAEGTEGCNRGLGLMAGEEEPHPVAFAADLETWRVGRKGEAEIGECPRGRVPLAYVDTFAITRS